MVETVRTVEVPLGPRAYPVRVGPGALTELGAVLEQRVRGRQVALILDGGLPAAVTQPVVQALRRHGPLLVRRVRGEPAKRLRTVERLCEAFARARLDREAAVVALGGGVVGDVAGFAAAVYARGIAVVQCPTTLVGMVDSAIGGKTGVNLAGGKNLVGAVHQPVAVLCDPGLLHDLPERDYRAAFGEVVKYAMVRDPGILDLLEREAEPIRRRDTGVLSELILRCCACKAAAVAADEHDQGERAILNYGHTIGHALEVATAYSRLRHGEAVAIGMRVAGRLSTEVLGCPSADIVRQDRALATFGLGRAPGPSVDPARVLAATLRDKKVVAGAVRWVLCERLGRATPGHQVPEPLVRAALAAGLAA